MKHRPPSADPEVREVLAGIRRVKGVRPRGKDAIRVVQLRRVLEAMTGGLQDSRNRALLLVKHGYLAVDDRLQLQLV